MPVDLRETRLPGVGVKYGFRTSEGGRLAIVLHNDGMREIYFFRHEHDDEPEAVIRLDDDEARQLGAVIGGRLRAPQDRRGSGARAGRADDRVGPGSRRQSADRKDACRVWVQGQDGDHRHRDPARPGTRGRRATDGRRPEGRHARDRRKARPVRGFPKAAGRGHALVAWTFSVRFPSQLSGPSPRTTPSG